VSASAANKAELATLELKQRRLQLAAERVGFVTKLVTAVVFFFVAAVASALIWDAYRSRGLIISAFSVPQSLADRGLTGELIAGKLQDRLIRMDAETDSLRASDTYRNAWSGNIQLQIPETGVSIGELQQVLRRLLGNQSQVTGSVYESGNGFRMTVRIEGRRGDTFEIPEAKLDAALEAAAKSIFLRTQPYLYATWLAKSRNTNGAFAVYDRLISTGPKSERAWGLLGRGTFTQIEKGDLAALQYRIDAAKSAPDNGLALHNLSTSEWRLGKAEDAFQTRMDIVRRMDTVSRSVRKEAREEWKNRGRALLHLMKADYGSALSSLEKAQLPVGSVTSDKELRPVALVGLHQPRKAMQALGSGSSKLPNITHGVLNNESLLIEARLAILIEQGSWKDAVKTAEDAKEMFRGWEAGRDIQRRRLDPLAAYAQARAGNGRAAISLIRPAPVDCYQCSILRGRTAVELGDFASSDRWFARALAQGPSLAFAEYHWASARFKARDYAGAMRLATIAHRKAPDWADPLKLLGDILLAQGRIRAAESRYAAAARRASDWRSLHISWAATLQRMGEKKAASKILVRARTMEQTADD
jgi:tetratricopeptide (TPR) repeat protein